MAIDRETIVSLHKKCESNYTSQMSFKFGVKRFGKWSRSSGRQARHTIDRANSERNQFEPSKWLKTRGKSWGQIPVVRQPNWPQRLESVRLRCAASLRKTSRPSPTRCRSAMSSHPRMDEWGSKDVDTFWTSWKMACCPIWCSFTRRNLTLSSASTIKTTVFEVGMRPWKAGEWVGTRIQPLRPVWSPNDGDLFSTFPLCF